MPTSRHPAILFLLLCLLSACGSDKPPASRGNILIVGDSLSAGYGIRSSDSWVEKLRERLDNNNHAGKVINASENGATTADGLRKLPALLEAHNPRVVILELGGNDGLRGAPAKDMRKNLREMIDLTEEAGAKAVVIRVRLPPRYASGAGGNYLAAYEKAAAGSDAILTQFLPLDQQPKRSLMQIDGIHPKASAQATMEENVWPAIRSALK